NLPEAISSPAFMLGFPRSGTTLLDIMLDAHTDVTVLSEVAAIGYVEQKLFDSQESGNKLRFHLKYNQVDNLRKEYFDYIDKLDMGVKSNSQKLLVEKMPFYTVSIPMIKQLFP